MELIGIAKQVYDSKYKYVTDSSIEDTWMRVAANIASVEADASLQAYWTQEFYYMLKDFKVLPGGRITAGAGTKHPFLLNCVSGNTLIHTKEGLVEAKNLSGEVETLSQDGKFRKAKWNCYGEQKTYLISLANGDTFNATAGHEWVVSKSSGGYEKVTTDKLEGRFIPMQHIDNDQFVYNEDDYLNGIQHGLVYGDGTLINSKTSSCLLQFGDSRELIPRYFKEYSIQQHERYKDDGGVYYVGKLPTYYKTDLPKVNVNSRSYVRGFIAGLIGADGSVDKRGSVSLHNCSKETLEQIRILASYAGLITTAISLDREFNPFNGEECHLYKLQFAKICMYNERLILKSSHRAKMFNSPKPLRKQTIQVKYVSPLGLLEKVFCCVEPETHTMVIGHGYLTGQCCVEPITDSIEGIYDAIKRAAVLAKSNYGTGFSFSNLRPKNAPLSVGGIASGPVSFMRIFDTSGSVIETGGGRRAASIGVLRVDHPDIFEFIDAKRQEGVLTQFNISVAVTRKFMEAVKDDDDFELVWGGEVYQIVKAREIWDKLIHSGFTYNDPGILFIDEVNKTNNGWYMYEIEATNPCGKLL